jgi:hypothetical protein
MGNAREITITLDKLSCQSEEQQSGSNPYIWPAMVFVDKSTGQVGVVSIPESSAHKILKSGMRPGDIIEIDPHVGTLRRFFDDSTGEIVLILSVALFEDNDTPEDAVTAGFRAFNTTLRSAIASRLLALASPEPDDVEAAREAIAVEVEEAVSAATRGALSTAEKIKVGLGLLTPDTSMGSGSASFEDIAPRSFLLVIGEPLGGRLLRYVDASQSGGGDVSAPQVIGRGGWQQFLHLFPGDGNLIYAVDTGGRLLRYVDASQTGGGDVSSPQVVGQGGWQQFRFLFAGAGNVIYAVDQAGHLLRYVDASQTGGGDVSSPQVIGRGGWQQFKFVFPGDGNVIYAVDQNGRLLRYVDDSQTGGGDVSSPQVIGRGGWQQFLHLFRGNGNVIYAVDQNGRLLRYVDASQTGGGDVSNPQVIGQGGWQQFGFLFSGPGHVIYAAERALVSKHRYEIAGRLDVRVQRCFDQMVVRNQAKVALDNAEAHLRGLRTRFGQAGSRAEREAIRLEIAEAQEQVAALQAQLAAAEAAFQACLASTGGSLTGGTVPDVEWVH